MCRARCRWALPFATAAAAILAACSGSSAPGGDDAPGDGGSPPPPFDGPPPQGLFPLHVSSDGASLTTDDGRPFLLHGEAAWSLIAQPSTSDAMRYLADRHNRGINALIVNLIEHQYADHAPANAAGDQPFTTGGDFSTHSEAYFAHADRVIDMAASQGMVVLLTPSYLGYMGGSEGWFEEMEALSTTKCRNYGDFVGQRYAGKHNIIWVWGGDFTPPDGSKGETCMKAIRDGILAAEPGVLSTGHWDPDTTSRSESAFTNSIKLVGVYNYQQDLQDTCRATRTDADSPRMPTFLIETCYEGETIQGCNAAPSEARRRMFWGWLGCGAGQFYGIGGMWQFSSSWPNKLGSPVSVSAQRLLAVAQQVAWPTLSDTAMVTSGGGTPGTASEVIARRTANGKQAVIYIPPGGGSSITVDLNQLTGSVTALWQDPTADHSVAAGDGLTGSHTFNTPGANSGHDSDWVLVLTTP
jgi:hypothetical protein